MFIYLFQSSGIGEPSVYHALVVIFLEFFAWGLLTMPVITVSTTVLSSSSLGQYWNVFLILGSQRHISSSHISDEWFGDGHQRHFIISKCPFDWGFVRFMGTKILFVNNCVFYLCTYTSHGDKYMVSWMTLLNYRYLKDIYLNLKYNLWNCNNSIV